MSHHYLKFKDVCYTYPNGFQALRGTSFRLFHGEKVALVGANGAGKSTLTLLTNGLLLPTKGTIDVGGILIGKKTLPTIRRTVGLLFQEADDQLFMPTVEEDVAFGPLNMGLSEEETEKHVVRALQAVGALHLRNRAGYRLSGGEKRSVAIATVLSMLPNILILDEPTSNLDPKARRQIIDLIKALSHTCLIATHDLDMVWEICERTMVMAGGRIVADGETRRIFDNRPLIEAAGLEQPYQAQRDFYVPV